MIALLPRSAVVAGLRRAKDMLDYEDPTTVAAVLGNGRRTSAQDTVPFALWSAARALGSYEDAFWVTAQAGGDVDTTCAIVGGIVAAGAAGAPCGRVAAADRGPAVLGARRTPLIPSGRVRPCDPSHSAVVAHVHGPAPPGAGSDAYRPRVTVLPQGSRGRCARLVRRYCFGHASAGELHRRASFCPRAPRRSAPTRPRNETAGDAPGHGRTAGPRGGGVP